MKILNINVGSKTVKSNYIKLFAIMLLWACPPVFSSTCSSWMSYTSTTYSVSDTFVGWDVWTSNVAVEPISKSFYYLYFINQAGTDLTVIRRVNADESTYWTYTGSTSPLFKSFLIDETEAKIYFADKTDPTQVNILNATTGAPITSISL